MKQTLFELLILPARFWIGLCARVLGIDYKEGWLNEDMDQ